MMTTDEAIEMARFMHDHADMEIFREFYAKCEQALKKEKQNDEQRISETAVVD